MGAKNKMFGLIWLFSYPIFMNTSNEIYDYNYDVICMMNKEIGLNNIILKTGYFEMSFTLVEILMQ